VVFDHVVYDEGSGVASEDVVDFVAEPGGVAELDGPSVPGRGDVEERVEAVGVGVPLGRELDEDGAEERGLEEARIAYDGLEIEVR
jgi:hypothetical protein